MAVMGITPYLYYRNVDQAMRFLSRAVGFKSTGVRVNGADGRTDHAAMKLGAGLVMMGRPAKAYRNPKELGQATQCLYLSTASVDALFTRAVKAGAAVLEEPADTEYGHRRCGLKDPEGHEWYFARPIRRRAGRSARTRRSRAAALVVACCLLAAGLSAQTPVKPPKNKYTPQQDVELGKQAAAEVRKQYPVVDDERIARYLATVGDRLVKVAPADLNEDVFEYSFTPVNLKEINAFALPGGPMFINRGLVDAAASEAELAGVMAHELAHVLLRHGTANASKAQNPWLQLGQIAGIIGGAVVGGAKGEVIAQGSQFGLGTLLLKYSREFEKQADLLGAQIMARAGYDPRALAQMFETIERASKSAGGSGPQWMSSHPNPGNRTQYINQEAEALTVAAPPDTSGFEAIKPVFASLPPPTPMRGAARAEAADEAATPVGTPGQPLPPPSTQYREISGGRIFQASVPANWTALPSKSAIKVVPENGYGEFKGQTVFACGVEFGVVRATSRDLAQATNAWLEAVAQSNPELQLAGAQQATRISGRSALATSLTNPSPLGGRERIGVYTTFLADGATLFYYLTVVPAKDAEVFRGAFRHVGESIRLTDVR
jgi:uncharacterized glyoxalase superfamily protein PhnB